ncbi:MAG: MoaD/ThiS family protein [Planctomycetes bacterium]|nr:MoaD/ThiS family protein [Planctomycetota bacterium]
MRVRVLFFAAAREAAATPQTSLELADGATVTDAFARLQTIHPRLAAVLPSCVAAIDEEFAKRTSPLRDGATLAVLPPVSGG